MENYYNLAKQAVYTISKGKVSKELLEDGIQYVAMKLWQDGISSSLPHKKAFRIACNKYKDWIRMEFGRPGKANDTKPLGKEFVPDYESHQIEGFKKSDIEDFILMKLSILKILTPLEQEFIDGVVQGLFLRELGQKMGYSESRAKQVYDGLLNSLETKLEEVLDDK